MNLIQPAGIDSLTVGGRVFTDLANLKYALTACSANGALKYSSMYRPAGTTYQVPVGKIFKVKAVGVIQYAAQPFQILIGYGDTHVGLDSAAAPTNAILIAAGFHRMAFATTTVRQEEYGVSVEFDIPAGKYPVVWFNATSGAAEGAVRMLGYEVDA